MDADGDADADLDEDAPPWRRDTLTHTYTLAWGAFFGLQLCLAYWLIYVAISRCNLRRKMMAARGSN